MIYFFMLFLSTHVSANIDWDENPVAAFINCENNQVDRNKDGKIDLWIERDKKNRIVKLSFDSTYQSGRPVLKFYFDVAGNVVKREEDFLDSENNVNSTIISNVEKLTKSLNITYRNHKYELYREEWQQINGASMRQTLFQGNNIVQFESDLAGAYDLYGLPNPDSICLQASPDNRLSAATNTKLMAQIDPATQVHDSCHSFKLAGNDGTPNQGAALSTTAIKSRLTNIISTGLQCMRNLKSPDGITPAHVPNRMADELLANVYARANNANAKMLTVHCDRPASRLNEAGYDSSVMATSSSFADIEFPAIFLNRLPEERFDQTIFHEILHLSGTQGHQCLHRNNDAREMDRIQSCAACCFPLANNITYNVDFTMLVPEISNDQQLKELSCSICSGNLSAVDSMIAYAKTEIVQGGTTGLRYAAIELRKAVQLDSDNFEAWKLLGEVSFLFANPTDARQMRAVAAFEKAASLAPNTSARSAVLDSTAYKLARSFSLNDSAGRMSTGNYLARGAATKDKDIAMEYEKQRTYFLMTMNSCGPHIQTTSGPDCRKLAFDYLSAMADVYKKMVARNKESKVLYRPFKEDTLAEMRLMITNYRDIGLPCMQQSNGDVKNCMGNETFQQMRETAFP